MKMGQLEQKLLVNMYGHKYLPNNDVKSLFEKGFQSTQYGRTLHVSDVKNVLRPELVIKFEKKWYEMKERAKPQIAYHGTANDRIHSILEKGLLVPGQNNDVTHKSDSGWWGGGIYVSPDATVSAGYSDPTSLIVCSVLMGNSYQCVGRMDGQPLMAGFDSHISANTPDGSNALEWILFDDAQVLPCYVVSFSY